MGGVITSLSPVDANSPSAFFVSQVRKPDGDTLREELKTSITEREFSPAMPDSPTFTRPASPRSRNA